MSVFADARAVVFLADHAANDAGGKINALGVGFRIVGMQPNGLTPAQSVVVLIDVPVKHVGEEFSVSIDLRREDNNEVVKMPGPTGQLDAMRIQQLVRAEPTVIQGVYLPNTLASRVQLVFAFPTGLLLQPGVSYRWRLEIEGQTQNGWGASFHVAGPQPGPVFGGPADSADPEMPPFNDPNANEESGSEEV